MSTTIQPPKIKTALTFGDISTPNAGDPFGDYSKLLQITSMADFVEDGERIETESAYFLVGKKAGKLFHKPISKEEAKAVIEQSFWASAHRVFAGSASSI